MRIFACCSREKDAEKDSSTDTEAVAEQARYDSYKLTDFKKVATLGVGGFGRVDLVRHLICFCLLFVVSR